MLPEPHYVREALQKKLLETAPFAEVFWTPSIAGKIRSAKPRSQPKYDRGDFFVGSYARLKHLRAAVDGWTPGIWAGSEIHHIVEHQHLNLLGVLQPFSERTYEYDEPCVVLSEKEHDSVINNAISDAIEMVLTGERGFDVVTHWRESNPGLSKLDWNEKGLRVAKWLSDEENKSDPMFTRTLIHDMLIEAYAFAYREPFLHPLRSIALAVIKGVSL